MRVSQRHFENYESIELLDVFPPNSLTDNDQSLFNSAINKLKKIKILLDKANAVSNITEIPEELTNQLEQQKRDFLEHVNNIAVIHSLVGINTTQILDQVNSSIARINQLYSSWFNNGGDSRILVLINTILSFDNPDLIDYKKKYDFRFKALDEAVQTAQKLNKELEEKAAKSVVSNYARIFEVEESSNKKASEKWFWAACILSFLLIIFILCSLQFEWFKITEKVLQDSTEKIVINFPNLVSKLFLISFILYIVSFCFKQFSINKNLESINNHRKNALNSYNLFVESIGKDDIASKNALMLQVAKAIYEHSSSGYLSAKQGDSSSPNIIEFTKFIADSKPL